MSNKIQKRVYLLSQQFIDNQLVKVYINDQNKNKISYIVTLAGWTYLHAFPYQQIALAISWTERNEYLPI